MREERWLLPQSHDLLQNSPINSSPITSFLKEQRRKQLSLTPFHVMDLLVVCDNMNCCAWSSAAFITFCHESFPQVSWHLGHKVGLWNFSNLIIVLMQHHSLSRSCQIWHLFTEQEFPKTSDDLGSHDNTSQKKGSQSNFASCAVLINNDSVHSVKENFIFLSTNDQSRMFWWLLRWHQPLFKLLSPSWLFLFCSNFQHIIFVMFNVLFVMKKFQKWKPFGDFLIEFRQCAIIKERNTMSHVHKKQQHVLSWWFLAFVVCFCLQIFSKINPTAVSVFLKQATGKRGQTHWKKTKQKATIASTWQNDNALDTTSSCDHQPPCWINEHVWCIICVMLSCVLHFHWLASPNLCFG